jgi:hypothetical protein
MSLPKNLFAWTAPGSDCPAYLSLNVVDGQLHLTGRGEKSQTGSIVALEPKVARELGMALIQATN